MRPSVAVLLVAGSGTRLGDAAGRPKSLVEVAGRGMLFRAVDALASVGVEEFILATGFREDLLKEATDTLPQRFTLCRNDEYASTQNAISLLRCQEAIGGRDFWKLDGDVVFDTQILERIIESAGAIVAGIDRSVELADEEMKVTLDGTKITAFGKGLDPATSAGESIGIETVSAAVAPELFEAIAAAEKAGRTKLYYEDVYHEMLAGGLDARGADITGLAWTEIDTPEDLQTARALFPTRS